MTSERRRTLGTIGAVLTGIGFAIVIHTSIRATDQYGAIVPGTVVLCLGLAFLANALIRD